MVATRRGATQAAAAAVALPPQAPPPPTPPHHRAPHDAKAARRPRSHAAALLAHGDVAPHLGFNKFILSGYRPPHKVTDTLVWLLLVWHNESANVLSHAAGAAVTVAWIATTAYTATPAGALVAVSDVATLFCFVCSAAYHALMSAMPSEAAYKALLSLDLAAVWAAQLGGALGLYSLLIPCAPTPVVAALTLLPSAAAAFLLVCYARDVRHRAVAFALPQLLRLLVPAVVAVFAVGGPQFWTSRWLVTHFAVEVAAAVGGALNATRFPERAWPGAFDLSPLNSHSLMHLLVTANLLAQHALVTARAAAVDATPELAACVAGHVAAAAAAASGPRAWAAGALAAAARLLGGA